MIKSEITCIGCPMGCSLIVSTEGNKVISITGHACKRGEEYGIRESTNPTRILTTTVEIKDGDIKLLSVKTDKDIPKSLLFECIREIKKIVLYAPITMGEIIIPNIMGTGVNIVATKGVKKISNKYNL
jgi:CxxC motif-containing protein